MKDCTQNAWREYTRPSTTPLQEVAVREREPTPTPRRARTTPPSRQTKSHLPIYRGHRDPTFPSARRAANAVLRVREASSSRPGAQPCTARRRPRGGQLLGAQQTETWNIFIASDSPAAKVPGARASRYRVYGVIGLHIGNYPKHLSRAKILAIRSSGSLERTERPPRSFPN